jgi:hypothetical protein
LQAKRRVQYAQGDSRFSGRLDDVASFQQSLFPGDIIGRPELASAEFDAGRAKIVVGLQGFARHAP